MMNKRTKRIIVLVAILAMTATSCLSYIYGREIARADETQKNVIGDTQVAERFSATPTPTPFNYNNLSSWKYGQDIPNVPDNQIETNSFIEQKINKLKELDAELDGFMDILNAEYNIESNLSYNAEMSINYAIENAGKYLVEYPKFNAEKDNTNFVSQCLQAGGIQFQNEWYISKNNKQIPQNLVDIDINDYWDIGYLAENGKSPWLDNDGFLHFWVSRVATEHYSVEVAKTIVPSRTFDKGDVVQLLSWDQYNVRVSNTFIITDEIDGKLYVTDHSGHLNMYIVDFLSVYAFDGRAEVIFYDFT